MANAAANDADQTVGPGLLSTLQLALAQHIDFSSVFGVDSSRLISGTYARCMCLHPRQPILALSVSGLVAEYDLVSGCKLGSTDAGGTPISISYTSDASLLIAVLQERGVVAWSPQVWKRRILLDSAVKSSEKPWYNAHLAITPGPQPMILYCQHGGTSVRLVYTVMPAPIAGKKSTEKQGGQLKGDNKKPIVAMAPHPSEQYVLILSADGTLSGCNINLRNLVTMWTVPVDNSKRGITRGIISTQNHPLRAGTGTALIAVGTSSGTVAMLESMGRSEARKMEQKDLVMEGGVVGIGINLAACQVTAFARDSRGDGHAYAWQLLGTSHGSTLRPLAVEPSSLGDAVQGNANSRQPGLTTATAAASSWQTLWGATPSWASNTGGASHVIGKVHTHPLTGQLVLHWLPTPRWESLASVSSARLAPADAASAKQLLTATVMQALQTSDPGASVGLAAVAPQHTPLSFWTGEGTSFSKHLAFSRHLYLLDGRHLAAYKPLTGKCAQIQLLPDSNTAGQQHMACKLLHSSKQAAFVFFYRVLEGVGRGAVLTPGTLEWTLVQEVKLGEEKSMTWTLPGASGAFLGAQHQYLAILGNDGATVSVYDLARIGPTPAAALLLDASSTGALNIFSGPQPVSQPAEDGSGGEGYMSSPSLVWVTQDGSLAIGDMPSVGGYRGRRAALQPKHTLPLALSESVLEVTWQQLTEDAPSGGPSQPGSLTAAAAVVTTQRLLIVGPDLTLLAATPQRSAAAFITSALWVGPALLYCDSGNAVSQLGWDSSVQAVCHLAGGSLPVLAATLADRLLIARGSAVSTGRVDCSPRCVALLQPLLAGWATLSARGFLPGGYWRARREMTALIRVYDSSSVTASLLTLLASAGFADLSLALAQNDAAFQLSFLEQAAAKAAAGQWGDAVGQVVADHKRSLGYPNPPAAGSAMHRRLVAIGRAAAAYGKFQAARESFAAAGQWVELMPLCALQGDFDALRDYAARVSGSQDSLDAKVLAEELLALESQFRTSTMNPMGGTKMSGDWTVTIDGGSGRTSYPDQEPLEVAPPGSLPMMETLPGPTGAATAGDGVGRLAQMDIAAAASYLGVGGGGRGVARRVTEEGDNDDEDGGFKMGGPGAPGAEQTGDFSDGEDDAAANTAAQAAARAAFAEDKVADTFYSSDEDESEDRSSSVTGSFVSGSGPSLSEPSKKFRVVIKSKEEMGGTGSTDLKAAAQGLRLPSPNTALAPPPSAFQAPRNEDWRSKFRSSDSFTSDRGTPDLSPTTSGVPSPMASPAGSGRLGGPAMRPSALGRSTGSLPPAGPSSAQGRGSQFDPPAAPTVTLLPPPMSSANNPMRPPPSPIRNAASGQGPIPVGAHAKGVSLMEAGNWDAAVKAFGQALDNARGDTCTKEAQYLAAVMLLKEGARVSGPASAKLKRFAAALKLDDKHHNALVQSAAAHNMEVGNFGYAGQQLQWLVTKASGSGNSAFIVQLQQAIQECEKKGGSNASVPREEDLETFAEIVGTATDADDVESSIGPLLAGS